MGKFSRGQVLPTEVEIVQQALLKQSKNAGDQEGIAFPREHRVKYIFKKLDEVFNGLGNIELTIRYMDKTASLLPKVYAPHSFIHIEK